MVVEYPNSIKNDCSFVVGYVFQYFVVLESMNGAIFLLQFLKFGTIKIIKKFL